ncbi:MAG: hypothetical protein RLZZ306_2074 [Bacteroidota bacterium]
MITLVLLASLMSSEMAIQEVHANDPGYSIHNYKHVNKAKAVARRDTNRGVRVSFDETNRDYKKPTVKGKENVLQIFRPTDSKDYLKVKNYKMPNG